MTVVWRTRLVLTTCALALGLLGAGAASASARVVMFQTPSRAVHCAYTSGFGDAPQVRCDVEYRTRFRRRPARCFGDFGQSFVVTSRGRGRAICVTDSTNVPHAPVLAYGRNRRFGAITCTSRTTGIRCFNTRGHGFFLSRARQFVY